MKESWSHLEKELRVRERERERMKRGSRELNPSLHRLENFLLPNEKRTQFISRSPSQPLFLSLSLIVKTWIELKAKEWKGMDGWMKSEGGKEKKLKERENHQRTKFNRWIGVSNHPFHFLFLPLIKTRGTFTSITQSSSPPSLPFVSLSFIKSWNENQRRNPINIKLITIFPFSSLFPPSFLNSFKSSPDNCNPDNEDDKG